MASTTATIGPPFFSSPPLSALGNNNNNHKVLTIDKDWRTQFNVLMEYKRATGHMNVPDDGTHLHRWVQQQNAEYTTFIEILEGRPTHASTTFNEDKLRLLRQAGFIFSKAYGKRLDGKLKRFHANCDLLKEFRNRFGHVEVPGGAKAVRSLLCLPEPGNNNNNEEEEEQALYNNNNNTMDDEEGDAKEGGDEPKKSSNNENNEETAEFKKMLKLGQWLSQVRKQMRQAESDPENFTDDVLTKERLERLDDIGVKANVNRGPRKRSLEVIANIADPQHQQLAAKRRLAAIKGTKRSDEYWEARFEEMKLFIQEQGHCMVPVNKGDYGQLRAWLDLQRKEYRLMENGEGSGSLTPNRMSRLASIGFEFQAPRQKMPFEERVAQWLEYRRTHDGKDPLRHSEDGIGTWISKLRSKKVARDEGRKTNLTQEQIDLLDSHGFLWSALKGPPRRKVPRKTWEERLEDLKEFRAENGHANVPQNVPGLGEWVHKQRTKYSQLQRGGKPNGLTAEKIELLNDAGFEWVSRSRPGTGTSRGQLKRGEDEDSEEDDEEEDDDDFDEEPNDDDMERHHLQHHQRTQHQAMRSPHHGLHQQQQQNHPHHQPYHPRVARPKSPGGFTAEQIAAAAAAAARAPANAYRRTFLGHLGNNHVHQF